MKITPLLGFFQHRRIFTKVATLTAPGGFILIFNLLFIHDILCPLGCSYKIYSQNHILSFNDLTSLLNPEKRNTLNNVNHSHIFGTINKQL